jgi:hypothetical protein
MHFALLDDLFHIFSITIVFCHLLIIIIIIALHERSLSLCIINVFNLLDRFEVSDLFLELGLVLLVGDKLLKVF